MISWSSSLASSTPETSLNVTFFWELEESFARLLPNEQGLVPAALHLPHDENPEADHEQDGRPVIENVGPGTGRGIAAEDDHALLREEVAKTFVLADGVGAERILPDRRRLYLPLMSLPVISTSATF